MGPAIAIPPETDRLGEQLSSVLLGYSKSKWWVARRNRRLQGFSGDRHDRDLHMDSVDAGDRVRPGALPPGRIWLTIL